MPDNESIAAAIEYQEEVEERISYMMMPPYNHIQLLAHKACSEVTSAITVDELRKVVVDLTLCVAGLVGALMIVEKRDKHVAD